jgi:hypothetical protein
MTGAHRHGPRIGNGLKYDDHFQHTHLGQIGHFKNEATS